METTLSAINAMTPAEFIAHFGDVAEHSPWVAERAFAARPFASRDVMIAAFESALHVARRDEKLALIRAHPDLATKAKLTTDSNREQAGAGLNGLDPEEFTRFTELNTAYKQRFGFPFVFAVKGATKHMILAAFAERVHNAEDIEFATAIEQICRIFRFRLEDRVTA